MADEPGEVEGMNCTAQRRGDEGGEGSSSEPERRCRGAEHTAHPTTRILRPPVNPSLQ